MLETTHIIRNLFVVLCLSLLFPDNSLLANGPMNLTPIVEMEADNPKVFFFRQDVSRDRFSEDSLEAYKEKAIFAAKNDAVNMASENAENYIKYSSDVGFIDSRYLAVFSRPNIRQVAGFWRTGRSG